MAERPIECSGCKKTISCHYTHVDLLNKHTISVCNDCPILEKLLHGIDSSEHNGLADESNPQGGLCCGTCGTTLESVRLGALLGCPECYDVFSDVLLLEMQSLSKLSSPPLHIGRSPGEDTETNPALRILALNEALSETLHREDYEQAAWLRDQIKMLSEAEDEKKADQDDTV